MNPPQVLPLGLDELGAFVRPVRWGCRLLDLRPADPAPRWHLAGSAWWPNASDPPTHLLPPRGSTVLAVAPDPERAREVARRIALRGLPSFWLDAPYDDALVSRLEAHGLALRPGPPDGAMWAPDRYLWKWRHQLPPPETGPVADLGAGNGRNSVFLAQNGWEVHAYDRLPDALALASQRAAVHGVEIHTYQEKLIAWPDLPPGPFALLLFLRFHHPRLLETAAEHLVEGGIILMSTYRAEGPGERAHRVPLPELKAWFPPSRWTLLDRTEERDERGEPLLSLVIQLRSAGEGSGV